jgi:hypothetical protein
MDPNFNIYAEDEYESDESNNEYEKDNRVNNNMFNNNNNSFYSPIKTNNDAFGLDMLINSKTNLDEVKSEKSDKTNIFQSSSEDEEDERIGGNTFTPNYRMSESDDIGFNNQRYYQPEKSKEEINREKAEILYQFDRMMKKGMHVPKQFTMDSNLEEMKVEFERLKRDKEVDASIAFQQKLLTAFTTGVEFLNTRFDPFDVKLDGWSESIHENLDDYNDVFEELHFKYKSKAKVAPEIKLIMMMGSSAFMFHLTNTMFKTSLPQMKDVFKQNPDLMKQFAGATANTMAQSGNDKTGMSSMFSNMFGSVNNNIPPPTQNVTMKGPSNLDSLLNTLDVTDENRLETMSTATQSEISDMTDTNSIRNLMRSNKKTKKNSMMI